MNREGVMDVDDDHGIWVGQLSMPSILQAFSLSRTRQGPNVNDDHDVTTTTSVVMGFVFCWSSWCGLGEQLPSEWWIESEIRPALEELVHQMKKQRHQPTFVPWPWNEVHLVCGHWQVDESDESLDRYIGDNHQRLDHDSSNQIPCPPEELPALAVVIQTSSQTQAVLHFLTSFQTKWGTNTNGSRRKLIMAQDWIPAAIKELDKLPMDLFFANGEMNDSAVMAMHSKDDDNQDAIRIFVAGDRSSVGKSSVCLGILGTLVQSMGYAPSSLAYIKPATQCEAPQLVQAYCDQVGIECVPVGPIVYYKGFTRAFLAGETESTLELLAKASDAVDRIARGKRIILIDGVGFPAVGSICGTDNAAVARACGYPANNNVETSSVTSIPSRHPMAVVLIGGSGVGAAVDAFHLNATYFEMHQVPVIGAVFNKLELDGFYSLENCRTQVTAYFSKNQHQQELGRQPFGFVPVFPGIAGDVPSALRVVDEWIRVFGEHVNVPGIVEAARRVKENMGAGLAIPMETLRQTSDQPAKKMKLSLPESSTSNVKPTLTREEIEQRAIVAGAAPSA